MTQLGCIFPGQGSQSIGMLSDIAPEFPQIEATFAEASEVLNYDLWSLVQQGPAAELDKTVHTQPALLTASYAIWRVWTQQKNIRPALLAGHSLGEYTALVCAGSLTFPDAVQTVALRGQYMQEATPVGVGALAAVVGLENDAVTAICEEVQETEVLAPVNFNSPGQVVIAGHTNAVERAINLAKTSGAKLAKLLPVSVPSHCLLMKPAAERLASFLMTVPIQRPLIPVLNNVDVTLYSDEKSIRDGLTRQLFKPVRWVEIIQEFARQGIKHIVECGPGKVLSGLNKRIVTDMQLYHTSDLSNLHSLLALDSFLL